MQTLDEERRLAKTKKQEIAAIKQELGLQVKILGSLLGVIWGTYFVNNVVLDNWIGQHLALQSGTLSGLLGTLVTPFLHLSPGHALTSSIALVVLGWWVMLRDTRDFVVVHLLSMLASGLGLWLFDDSSVRWFGWAGVAFGMAGYLMTSGLFERRAASILSSLVAVALLGGIVWGTLTSGAVLGYVGVLGGTLGGVAAAAYLGKRRQKHADPVDLVGSPARAAEMQFDFGEDEDDAITHLQRESRALRHR